MILHYIETTSGECFSEIDERFKYTWIGEVNKITKLSHGRFRIDTTQNNYPDEETKHTIIIYPANIKRIYYNHGNN